MEREALFRKKVLGQLTPEEEASLASLFSQEPDAKAEFQSFKEVMLAVAEGEKEELKDFLRSIDKEKKKVIPFPIRWVSVAAGLIILLGLSYLFWPMSTEEELYETYFDTYPNVYLPTTRNQPVTDSLLSTAFFQYESGKFQAANQSFHTYLDTAVSNPSVRFYHAMSLMQLDSMNQAEKLLSELTQEAGEFSDEALWYRSLIQVKLAQYEKARQSLAEFQARGTSFRKEEAKRLRESLMNK